MKQTTRFIRFFGGRNILFSLVTLILIGILFFIYNKVSFIFHPFIVVLSTVAPPAIIAFIVYYLLNPIVNLLERLHIKRLWGIIIIIIVFISLIAGLVMLVTPSIQKQVNDFITEAPGGLQSISDQIEGLLENSFLSTYYDQVYQWITSAYSSLSDDASESFNDFYDSFKNVANTITNVVVALVTFPFVLFFLLKDRGAFKQYVLHIVPPKFRSDVGQIFKNIDTQVGSYIRGQLIVAACVGVLLYIGYLIIGLEYAITLAVIAGVTNVVPYVGPMVAISPAVVIAIIDSPFMLLKLAIVWVVVQFSEGHFISPNVMGHTMQIHPLTIMFVLLIGGKLFGIVGIILGIPGYAILKVFIMYLYGKFKLRYNKYYAEEAGPYNIEKSSEK